MAFPRSVCRDLPSCSYEGESAIPFGHRSASIAEQAMQCSREQGIQLQRGQDIILTPEVAAADRVE